MSLVGFKAQNHPQQIARRGRQAKVDDRTVPTEVFAPLHERFRFTVDAAATAENARLPRYWTAEDDGLTQGWSDERVWCNPPYSDIGPWVRKAWDEWTLYTPELIVMLLPANRTEQGWWQHHVEPYRDQSDGHMRVEFLPGRMRFIQNGRTEIGPNERPPFGCCLLIWGEP